MIAARGNRILFPEDFRQVAFDLVDILERRASSFFQALEFWYKGWSLYLSMTWNKYKHYLTQSYDQFIAEHQIDDDQIDKDVRYEKITDVDCIRLGYGQHLFYKAGQLKLIYVSGGELATRIWDEFKRGPHAGAPSHVVRSRAGKTANQIVIAEQGITASIQRDEINFIELYPPQSTTDYLANIYQEPKPFIR